MNGINSEAAEKEQVEAGLKELCIWAASLTLEQIPSRVLAQAVLILGDNIAAALSAADEPELRAYHEQLIAAGTASQATLLRRDAPQVAMIDAAVGNGLASTWNELDDGYTRTAEQGTAGQNPVRSERHRIRIRVNGVVRGRSRSQHARGWGSFGQKESALSNSVDDRVEMELVLLQLCIDVVDRIGIDHAHRTSECVREHGVDERSTE